MKMFKALGITAVLAGLAAMSALPASAMQVGVTNTVTNTVTSGNLVMNVNDQHWDCGYQDVWAVSGDLQEQVQGSGIIGLGGSLEGAGLDLQHPDVDGGQVGLGGGLEGNFTGSEQVSLNATYSHAHTEFRDYNVSTQTFNGQQTTISTTTSSATFTNF